MGLGLTISKLIVELLGGAIGVESEPEKGSRFYFSIPLPPDEEKEFIRLQEALGNH
jgi:signal transduction histidine kinase